MDADGLAAAVTKQFSLVRQMKKVSICLPPVCENIYVVVYIVAVLFNETRNCTSSLLRVPCCESLTDFSIMIFPTALVSCFCESFCYYEK